MPPGLERYQSSGGTNSASSLPLSNPLGGPPVKSNAARLSDRFACRLISKIGKHIGSGHRSEHRRVAESKNTEAKTNENHLR
ncbi:unnamed protein product, partial [Iphiclides podalirius]